MSIDEAESRAAQAVSAPPRPMEARLMPWAATMAAVAWGIAFAVSLVVFYFGLVMGSFVPWLALPITVAGVVAGLYAAWRLWWALRARRLDAPVILIGADGFRDVRIGSAVPWCDITALTVEQPGTQTFLRIAARDAGRFVTRGRALRRRVARAGALVSSLSGLDAPPDALVAAAKAYRTAAVPY